LHKNELANSIYDFGTAFQILDDLNSINNFSFAELKGCSDDLREGKLSFPILYFFKESQNINRKRELEEMLNKRQGSLEELSRLQVILNEGIR
jgi:geranylgeranyl pyrophosphate synthase